MRDVEQRRHGICAGAFPECGSGAGDIGHASDALKATYLDKIHSGEWSGTMNLTESGAGSDLGPMKTRAEREGEHYRIFGQKIYITWGDHDATENIIPLWCWHASRMRPRAAGVFPSFWCPKFLVNADGTLGERNDAYPGLG